MEDVLLDSLADMEEAHPAKDPFRQYLQGIGKVPLLTRGEEIALARKLEEGKEAIRALSERTGLEEGLIRRAIRVKLAGMVQTDGLPGLGDALSPKEAEAVIARLKALPKPEKRLLLIAQEGEIARLKLIEANLRLVVHVAKRWMGVRGLEFSDLVSAGNGGLMEAVERFDWRRGNKFSTYALWWIEQAIRRAIANESRTVRLPVHTGDTLRKVRKATEALESELGRRATYEEIAERLGDGWDARRVEEVLGWDQDPLSLDEPVDEEGEDLFGDFIEGGLPSPVEHAERRALEEGVERLLSALPEREAFVLRLRYGLGGDRPHTLEEVGKVLGLTRERVRQIEGRALRRVRRGLKNDLKIFLE